MRAAAAYDELIRLTREESLLTSCATVLGWDEETYMPHGGVAHRGNQLALLAGMSHDRATNPRIGELLAELEGAPLVKDPETPAAANVRELRRLYDRLTRLPRGLIEETVRITSFAQQAWAEARARSDFGHFRPWLEKILQLKRREAESIGPTTTAYDTLLEEYEPGARGAAIAPLFAALRHDLLPLVSVIQGARERPRADILRREYPLDRQRLLAEALAVALGFDFQRGRLDLAIHPFFSRMGPDDCRITTRYSMNDFSESFFGTLHEVGHALYEQGLDPLHYGTPMGEGSSLGVHESQSRLWENVVGRSRAFWRHFFPRTRQLFPQTLSDVGLDDFHLAVNRVEPSLIRVRADEVTYNLHILIRFELEQALLTGVLPVADLPAAWNDSYRHYLGITPANDAEGCLQDGHWSAGMIGYFPTYTLGNLFAAQLFDRASHDIADLDEQFARGDFGGLLGWLRDRVHRHGQRYPAPRLIEQAAGSPPDHQPLVQALWRKYGELYQL